MKTNFKIKWIVAFSILVALTSFNAFCQPAAIIHVGTNQQVGNTICFDGSQSYAYNSSTGENDIFLIKNYAWTFGDGTSKSGSDLTTVTHSYSTISNYTVTLTVTGMNNQTNSTSVTDSVSNLPTVTVYQGDGPSLIQSKINSMSGGGIVNIQAGTYNITSTIQVPAGVQLKGSGIGQTKFQNSISTAGKYIFEMTGDNVSISDIEFYALNQSDKRGISSYGKRNLYVNNCKLHGFEYACNVSAHGSATFEDNYIIENHYDIGYGIHVADRAYAMVRDNSFSNNRHSITGGGADNNSRNTGYDFFSNTINGEGSVPVPDAAIDMHASGHGRIRINDNVIKNVSYGIGLKDGWGEIKNNSFENISGYFGIKFGYPVYDDMLIDDAGVYDMVVEGNSFTGPNTPLNDYMVRYGNNITINQQPVNISFVDEWWKGTSFNGDKIKKRVVSGDFDNDGYNNDIAAMYDYGTSQPKVFVWKARPDGSIMKFISFGSWRNESSFYASKVSGRFVSGDFDNDGYIDDIAAMYDYGTSQPKIFVWKSNKSGFSYPATWRTESSFHAWKVTGRFVSGDFDNDGFVDDIAAMYDYGTSQPKIFVWFSNGTSFSVREVWRTESSFYAYKVTDRFVSGDFDGDGFKDDIAAVYDYNSTSAKIWVWESNSQGFSYPKSKKTLSPYNANGITGRMVSGDFYTNDPADDIAGLYSSSTTPLYHEWLSHTYPFEYLTYFPGWKVNSSFNSANIQYRVVSGDFDCDNKDDNIAFFHYTGNNVTSLYFSKSMVDSDQNTLKNSSVAFETINPEHNSLDGGLNVNAFPNPFSNSVTMTYFLDADAKVNLTVYNLSGQVVNKINEVQKAGHNTIIWNGSDNSGNQLANGIYLYQLIAGDHIFSGKISIQK